MIKKFVQACRSAAFSSNRGVFSVTAASVHQLAFFGAGQNLVYLLQNACCQTCQPWPDLIDKEDGTHHSMAQPTDVKAEIARKSKPVTAVYTSGLPGTLHCHLAGDNIT